jgi:hypothetical protein
MDHFPEMEIVNNNTEPPSAGKKLGFGGLIKWPIFE